LPPIFLSPYREKARNESRQQQQTENVDRQTVNSKLLDRAQPPGMNRPYQLVHGIKI
jgi:hypothetical protein